jgi:hypothetical protein
MIFLSLSSSCCSTNFLNFSSVRSCSSRGILRASLVPRENSLSTCSFSRILISLTMKIISQLVHSAEHYFP